MVAACSVRSGCTSLRPMLLVGSFFGVARLGVRITVRVSESAATWLWIRHGSVTAVVQQGLGDVWSPPENVVDSAANELAESSCDGGRYGQREVVGVQVSARMWQRRTPAARGGWNTHAHWPHMKNSARRCMSAAGWEGQRTHVLLVS